MWNPYNKQGSRPGSRCRRWNSPSAIPAKSSFRPLARKDSNAWPRRGLPSSAAAPPVRPWRLYYRGPVSAICVSSIAITSSPAICSARCCSTNPMPPNRCPRPSPRRARSGASTPPFASSPTPPISRQPTWTSLLGSVDLILDGTDNFETRYLINDFAVSKSVPWIYAAAVASYGVTMTVLPGETACLACVFPDSPRGIGRDLRYRRHPEFGGEPGRVHRRRPKRSSCWSARATSSAARCCPTMSGPTITPRSAPPSRARVAGPATSTTSCTSPAKGVRTSRSADAIPCRFTSASVPSTSPKFRRRLTPHGAGASQRVRAEVLARSLRADAFPRRPRHHQGHHRHRHRAQPLRQICRVVRSIQHSAFSTQSSPLSVQKLSYECALKGHGFSRAATSASRLGFSP